MQTGGRGFELELEPELFVPKNTRGLAGVLLVYDCVILSSYFEKKHRDELKMYVKRWVAIGTLKRHFLREYGILDLTYAFKKKNLSKYLLNNEMLNLIFCFFCQFITPS